MSRTFDTNNRESSVMFLKLVIAFGLAFTLLNSQPALSITKEEAKAAATIELLKEQQEKEVRDAINTAKREIVREAPADDGWGNKFIGVIMFLLLIGFLSKSFLSKGSQSKLNKLRANADNASRDLDLARLETIQANKNLVKTIVLQFEKMEELLASQQSFDLTELDEDAREVTVELLNARADLKEVFEKERPKVVLKLKVAMKELLERDVDIFDIPKHEKALEILSNYPSE